MTVDTGISQRPADLSAAVFVALTSYFFDRYGDPVPFELRDKRNTQDDPFDELVKQALDEMLPSEIKVLLSNKPLVTPDLVVARPEETPLLLTGGADTDERRVIGIEVKKLNATPAGGTPRGSGMDYNTTPPSAKIKVEAQNGAELIIRSFYLFVVLADEGQRSVVVSMALVDGAVLNEDFELYSAVTGLRSKQIGLGTYGDGLNRERPMMVFSNPLGWVWTNGEATLIHPRADLTEEQPALTMRRAMTRTTRDQQQRIFFCYRLATAEPAEILETAEDPFPTPANRSEVTTRRGRFRITLA